MKESRADYVRRRKQEYKEHTERHHQIINTEIWRELISQWEFVYDMDQQYQDK